MSALQSNKTMSPLMRARGAVAYNTFSIYIVFNDSYITVIYILIGTLSIQSPEMLSLSESSFKLKGAAEQKGFSSVSADSDIWSLGCLLAELFTGSYLFGDRTWPDLYVSLFLSSEIVLPLSNLKESMRQLDYRMPRFVENLVISILKHNPCDRISIHMQKESVTRFLDEVCHVHSPSKKYFQTREEEVSDHCDASAWPVVDVDVDTKKSLLLNTLHLDSDLLTIPKCSLTISSNVVLNCGLQSDNKPLSISAQQLIPEGGFYEGFRVLPKSALDNLSISTGKSHISAFSYEHQKNVFKEWMYANSSCTEVRIIDSVSENISSNIDAVLDLSKVESPEFMTTWINLRSMCMEAIKAGGQVYVTVGKETLTIPITSDALLEAMDAGSEYCECSSRILTCGILFAWSLLTINLSDILLGSTWQSPLTSVDRLLPGISQVCCQMAAKEYMRRLCLAYTTTSSLSSSSCSSNA